MNNKGQLKREFPPGHGRKENNIEGKDGSDHDTDNKGELVGAGAESMCQPGKHKWKHDQCMVCSVCGECTGYGAGCVSASRQNRNPGMLYGCGSGDSGCSECGACRVCAGEAGNDVEGSGQDGAGPVPVRDLIRLDLLAG